MNEEGIMQQMAAQQGLSRGQSLPNQQGLGYNIPQEAPSQAEMQIMQISQAVESGQISPEEGNQMVSELKMQEAQVAQEQLVQQGNDPRNGQGRRTGTGGYMSDMAEWAKQQAMTQ